MSIDESTEAMYKQSRLGPVGRVAVVCLSAIDLVALPGSSIMSGQVEEFTFIVMAVAVAFGLLAATGWRWATVPVGSNDPTDDRNGALFRPITKLAA